MKAPSRTWQRIIIIAVWAIASIIFGGQLTQGPSEFDSLSTLITILVALACTAGLLWWIPNPISART